MNTNTRKSSILAFAVAIALGSAGSAFGDTSLIAAEKTFAFQQERSKTKTVKKIAYTVSDERDFDRALDLARRETSDELFAINLTCSNGSSAYCADKFVAHCDEHDGGLSTNPDGSITCSIQPQ